VIDSSAGKLLSLGGDSVATASSETFAGKRAGRKGRPPPSSKGPYIAIAAGSLLATAGGLVNFFSDDSVARWIGLVSALLAATVGISFFASMFSGRRLWQETTRTELLRAVVTVVSALERRRREESSLNQD
jgi:hypothetical protein